MQGNWIALSHDTPLKPEVYAIAEALKIKRREVVGILIDLWIWADRQTYDGEAGRVSMATIDDITVDGFSAAMQECGWLDVADDGSVRFPGFGDHNGQTAKRRLKDASRQAKRRAGTTVSRSDRDAEPTKPEQPPAEAASSGATPAGPTSEPDSTVWDGVARELRECGVRAYRKATTDASASGWQPAHAAAVVNFWRSRDDLTAYDLKVRFEETAEMAPADGWAAVAEKKRGTKRDQLAEATAKEAKRRAEHKAKVAAERAASRRPEKVVA